MTHAAPARVVADLLSVRGAAGRFLVPGDSRTTAARSLLSYNRLRPLRVRAVRAAMGSTLRLGAGGLISEPRQMVAPPDAPVLLDHLASVLDVPRVVFAATEKGGSGFVTPVLQLFTPDGRNVGFAKIGWDAVTDAMIRTEADALERAARAGWDSVSVPEVVWHGEWEDLSLLVTAPMPRTVRRLRPSELPPISPLLDVALLDGPTQRHRVDMSTYWADARATAAHAIDAGRTELADRLDAVAREHEAVELTFGRWHGDWVEWNLARADGRLFAWDWAYSAPDVPFGFDLLQFFHLRHRVLREAPPAVALDPRRRRRATRPPPARHSRRRGGRRHRAASHRGAAARGARAPGPHRRSAHEQPDRRGADRGRLHRCHRGRARGLAVSQGVEAPRPRGRSGRGAQPGRLDHLRDRELRAPRRTHERARCEARRTR